MAKTKFIPSPWFYGGDYIRTGNPVDGKGIAEILHWWGWNGNTPVRDYTDDVLEATGNLMAAAPDLYTELNKLVELLGRTNIAAKLRVDLCGPLLALIKARGEKP